MKWPKRETERVDASTEPSEASAALSVRLFGELELRLGDERLPRLESARARSLLAFLLLHRDAPQSRHRLAFMLWPDSNEGQALTNLRHLIHTLRQASPELDQFLDVTSQTLQWREDASSWIDVAAFDAAQAAADAPGLTARRELEALRTAIDLYRGDLLEGCYDEWVLDVRERFRDQYLSHLRRLAEVLASDGENTDAGAEVFGIGRDGGHGLGRSLEQDAVDRGLILVGNVGDFGRQREHDVEVRHRQ
jgi:DNA-binding SARP family transcriptional activator